MDLRFVRHSVAALLCAVALTSCGFSTTDRVLRKMSEAQFILPEGCLSVDGGHVSIYSPDSIAKAKFVIFYGPEECGSCRIDRLEGLDTFYTAWPRPAVILMCKSFSRRLRSRSRR